jgi:hypothetical protein
MRASRGFINAPLAADLGVLRTRRRILEPVGLERGAEKRVSTYRRQRLFRPVRLVKRRPVAPARRAFSPGLLAGGALIAAYGLVQCYRTPFWTYSNYWGGAVFAPLVVVIGLLVMVISPFRLVTPAEGDAERVRFPHEEVERPWTPE